VVIDKINIQRLTVLETKYNAPVGANRHRSKPFPFAFQRVQPQRRSVQPFEGFGGFERAQNFADALRKLRRCWAVSFSADQHLNAGNAGAVV